MAVSQTRIDYLKSLGYFIENMEAVYGEEWAGAYRFMNSITGDFQDVCESYSIEAAWQACDKSVKGE